MTDKYPQPTNRICPDCKSKILLVNVTTTIEEGQFSPVTTSQYECSNKECSDAFKARQVVRKAQEDSRKEKKARRF